MGFVYPRNQQRHSSTIKPVRWGSDLDVQYAVRRNCERLGLPVPVGLWPMWEGSGNPYNVFGQQAATNSGTWDSSGGVKLVSASSQYMEDVSIPSALVQNTTNTVSLCCNVLSLASISHAAVASRNSTNTGWICKIEQRNNTTRLGFTVNSVADYSATSLVSKLGRQCISWAWTSGSSVDIVLDAANQQLIIGALNISTAIDGISFGVKYSGTYADYGDFINYLSVIWTERLALHQIATLHDQPYALIQPVSRPVFFDLAAATFKAAWAVRNQRVIGRGII